jgi:hypothetical protein
LAEKLSVW